MYQYEIFQRLCEKAKELYNEDIVPEFVTESHFRYITKGEGNFDSSIFIRPIMSDIGTVFIEEVRR